MDIRELQDKKICILGFGREGQAVLRAIETFAPDASVTIADKSPEVESGKWKVESESNLPLSVFRLAFRCGKNYLQSLTDFDYIIKSPGVPPCPELDAVKEKVINSTQIFLDSIASSGATVIGVTGSKGKSTTASLISEILKNAGKDVHLVGNIGNPAISLISKAKEGTIFVIEMSSYQLMNLTVSPHIAVITSFFPEHLDYHASTSLNASCSPLENYLEAKKHITRFQTENDIVFFNSESKGAKEIADESSGNKISVDAQQSPLPLKKTKLIGTHNLTNIALASAVAKHLEISDEATAQAITGFNPLPHRLQQCGEHHGIEWVDDSISTTPESTIAALEALEGKVKTLILGGQDRGLDFTELGKAVAKAHVDTVILMGESAPRIKKALEDANVLADFHEAASMEEAVKLARTHTSSQSPKSLVLKSQIPICLLSPASPSYGMFKDFEERGEAFLACITKGA